MIELLLAFALGIILGVYVTNLFHKVMIKTVLKDYGIDNEQKLRDLSDRLMADLKDTDPEAYAHFKQQLDEPKETVRIRLEQHQGVLFAYREDDSQFVGQGVDQESLIASITHRVKGVTIEIVNGELLQKNNT
jgi:hypothetical protein